jgi:ankyrin repeat protein
MLLLGASSDIVDRRKRFQRQNSLTDLHEAVLKNCENSIQESILSGVPIDLGDHMGQTPLYYASERGYNNLVRLLLDHKARHDLVDINQTSPLWVATREGHDGIVLILLQYGACPNQKAQDQTTALYHASYEGHLMCVYHLIRYKAYVNWAKNSGASPLFVAARNGHHRIVKHLLKHGADPSHSQADLRSPLHTALLYNRIRCVRLILGKDSNILIEQTDIYGWSHLHFLAKKGGVKAARIYFHYLKINGKNCDVTQTDWFGNTALHIAVLNRRTKFIRYLIDKGFKSDQANKFGWTPDTIISKYQQKNATIATPPKIYLQHLLSIHHIRYTSEEEEMREEVEAYVKMLVSQVAKFDLLFLNNIICSGSYYEGTRVGLPDEFDYMINLTEIERLCTFIDDHNDPAGFGRLFPLETEEACEKLSSYLEPITGCVSSAKVRKQFYQLLTSARAQVIRKETLLQFKHLKFEWTSSDKRCGTAIHAEWYGSQYACLTIKIDVVPCLTVYQWPKKAKINCPLEKPEYQIIARSPKPDQTYFWRISTSRAELVYFQSLIPEIMNAYLCLKILRNLNLFTCKIDKITYTADELITSYMFKTEFLYEINRYSKPNQWINGSLIHRVMSILKRLQKNLHIGSIQSYYIQNYNVIDNDDYIRLRSFEIKYIRTIQSQLKEKIMAMNKKLPHRHTFVVNESFEEERSYRLRSFSIPS